MDIDEMLINIFKCVDNEEQYKSIICVNKRWNHLMNENYPKKKHELCNKLWSIIMALPDKKWDWAEISVNSIITIDIIKLYPEMPWDWLHLSSRMDIEFILDNLDKQWDFWVLSIRTNIYIILDNLDLPWYWDRISYNDSVTMEIIELYPELNWNYFGLSRNPKITLEFIKKHIDKIDFGELSKNHFNIIL